MTSKAPRHTPAAPASVPAATCSPATRTRCICRRGTTFEIRAKRTTEIAECRSPTARRFAPRVIRPEDCGFEVRGGGNATRQIIDILPPAAEADRLLVCEVLTPAGNWSSYPPHKHDRHNPPVEADLEETYYYRFSEPGGYGIQRLYTLADREEQVLRVTHGDLVMVREGYHPFVAAPGVDAYYLNTLAGSFRSMAATDDPRYAHLRASWPPPDPRVPMIAKPSGDIVSTPNFQLPTPKGSRSNNGAKVVATSWLTTPFTPLFERFPWELGVGSWELR